MLDTLQQRIDQHQRLSNLRLQLLRLHKQLLNMERITYEQVRGQVSSGELLQLVIHHDQFAWLHQLSQLIVQIDQSLSADEPISSETLSNLLSNVRTLLTPDEWRDDFAMKYNAALQRSPDVVLAHADVATLLTSV